MLSRCCSAMRGDGERCAGYLVHPSEKLVVFWERMYQVASTHLFILPSMVPDGSYENIDMLPHGCASHSPIYAHVCP